MQIVTSGVFDLFVPKIIKGSLSVRVSLRSGESFNCEINRYSEDGFIAEVRGSAGTVFRIVSWDAVDYLELDEVI